MQLSVWQLFSLIELALTSEGDSLNCDACLELLDHLAQTEFDGTVAPEALESVRAHLEQCECCKDEFDALMVALRAVLS